MSREGVKRFWRRGNAEVLGTLYMGPLLCLFFVQMVAIMSWASASTSAEKAVEVASRAAAVCSTYQDATSQAQKVAESAVFDPNVTSVRASVQLLEGEFKPGKLIKVTCTVKVRPMTPFDFRNSFSASIPVSVEGDDFELGNISP